MHKHRDRAFYRCVRRAPRDLLWLTGLALYSFLVWLSWGLPRYSSDRRGTRLSALNFYLNVIRGPYTCAFCGRQTTQGPDLEYSVPAHCGRRICSNRAHD